MDNKQPANILRFVNRYGRIRTKMRRAVHRDRAALQREKLRTELQLLSMLHHEQDPNIVEETKAALATTTMWRKTHITKLGRKGARLSAREDQHEDKVVFSMFGSTRQAPPAIEYDRSKQTGLDKRLA
jgi:hypothetical protein